MSETPGPRARDALDPERPLGRRAVVEDRVHVPDEQDPWSAAAPPPCRSRRSPSCGSPSAGACAAPLDVPARRRGTAARTRSAIRLTPAGEYEPQSMLTMRLAARRRTRRTRAATRSRSAPHVHRRPTLACAAAANHGRGRMRDDRSDGRGRRRAPAPPRASSRSSSTDPGPAEVRVRVDGERPVPLRSLGDRARQLGRAVPDAARPRGRRRRRGGRRRGGRPSRPAIAVLLAWAVPCGDVRRVPPRPPAPLRPRLGAAAAPAHRRRRAAHRHALARHVRDAHRGSRRAGDPRARRDSSSTPRACSAAARRPASARR